MIRELGPDDAEAYAALRHEMLIDAPLAFASSPQDPGSPSLEDTRARLARTPESAVFGAFEPGLKAGAPRFAGACGDADCSGEGVACGDAGAGLSCGFRFARLFF